MTTTCRAVCLNRISMMYIIPIKIEFSMHEHEDKYDCWLNWSDSIPGNCATWIEAQHQKAMSLWYEAEWDSEDQRNAEIERQERDDLARLKAKYEPPAKAE